MRWRGLLRKIHQRLLDYHKLQLAKYWSMSHQEALDYAKALATAGLLAKAKDFLDKWERYHDEACKYLELIESKKHPPPSKK